MRRRLFLASSAALLLTRPARADDAEVARKLVGVWVAKQYANGMEIDNKLTLVGNGNFAFTSVSGPYQVTQTGNWIYGEGWIQFNTTWSSSLDPSGSYLVMAPLQVLEVTDEILRTQLGTATRVG